MTSRKDGTYKSAMKRPRVIVDVSSGTLVERIDYDERGNTLNDTNPISGTRSQQLNGTAINWPYTKVLNAAL